MSQAADDGHDMCEVEVEDQLSFAFVDDGSSDSQDQQDICKHADVLDENAVIDCFDFSVNAHIKGKFEIAKIAETDEEKKLCIAKEGGEGEKIDQNPSQSSKTDPVHNNDHKGDWFPASLKLPEWAASD